MALPLVITIHLVRGRDDGKLYMEIEVVLSDGEIISKTVDATRTVQLDFSDEKSVRTLRPDQPS